MKENKYPAHIKRISYRPLSQKEKCDGYVVQSNKDHLRHVALYARNCLSSINLGEVAYVSGLLHDMGKYTAYFADYIEQAVKQGEQDKTVIHSFQGARYILDKLHDTSDLNHVEQNIAAEIIAYAIRAHHGQFDLINSNSKQHAFDKVLMDVIDGRDLCYNEAVSTFHAFHSINNDIFKKCINEVSEQLAKAKKLAAFNNPSGRIFKEDFSFFVGKLARLVSSAVIEADCRDTARFMNDERYIRSNNQHVWRLISEHINEYIADLSSETEIDLVRSEISSQCLNAASYAPSIYRLNCPPGSGKTISSVQFAVEHAKQHKKDRVFFISPMIQPLEQNADVIRNLIGNSSYVIEHHSNAVAPKKESYNENEKNVYVSHTWDAPIVVTTLVQFMNAMEKDTKACVRRMQSLVNSVIIFDEVQQIPPYMMSHFNMCISFLSAICNCTILLCTATQPPLENVIVKRPIRLLSDDLVQDISVDRSRWDVFKRYDVEFLGKMSLLKNSETDSVQTLALCVLDDNNSLLIVTNKKEQSRKLYVALSGIEGVSTYHLSNGMCQEHKRSVISSMKEELLRADKSHKVVCVTTPVIEAGVDVSFESGIRFLSGIDNVIQAFGRVNRSGEFGHMCKTYVVDIADEDLSFLPDIMIKKKASYKTLEEIKENNIDFDIHDGRIIELYYKNYFSEYKTNSRYQDNIFQYHKDAVFEDLTTYGCVADNSFFVKRLLKDNKKYFLNQSFLLAGSNFNVIKNETYPVIIPKDKCAKDNIRILKFESDVVKIKKAYKLLMSKYCVPVYEYERQYLASIDSKHPILEKIAIGKGMTDAYVYVLRNQSGLYDESFGLISNKDAFSDNGVD